MRVIATAVTEAFDEKEVLKKADKFAANGQVSRPHLREDKFLRMVYDTR